MKHRILIVEDEPFIAHDLQQICNEIIHVETKVALSVEEAQKTFTTFLPNIVISDINLSHQEIDGISLLQEFYQQYTKLSTILITAHTDAATLKRVDWMPHPVFIVKPFSAEQVKTQVILHLRHINISEPLDKLSLAENEILMLIGQGFTTNAISKRLFISSKTVQNHRYNICKKLDIPSRNNALVHWLLAHQ